MSEFALLNGNRIVSGSICIPRYGIWVADLVMASAVAVADTCEVKVGNLEMTGHKFRDFAFTGSQSARVFGGRGGWRRNVDSQSYYSTRGIKYSLLLNDVASLVGEQVRIATDRVWGTFFTRKAGLAQRVLSQLLGDVWYTDLRGITQCQERTETSLISSEYTVVSASGAKGAFVIATEDVASWQPARKFKSITMSVEQEISMTSIQFDDKGTLRIHVLTSTGGES